MQSILLDRYGDAKVPDGYELIDSEVLFLRAATAEGKWFIRGQRLCEWAEVFFAGRDIRVKEVLSPCRALREAIPTLSEEQAAELSARLGARFYNLEPVTAQTVAQELFPIPLCRTTPSREHAAEWLLWLDQQQMLDEADKCILRVMVNRWARQAPEELKRIYEAADAEGARRILNSWLGILPDESLTGLGEFPIDVPPSWLEKAAEAWRPHIIQTKGNFVAHLLRHSMPLALKRVVGREAAVYFGENPQYLTEEHLRELELASCLEWQQRRQLRELVQPPEPSDVPETPEEVLKWFTDEYLPYREWQWRTNNQQARRRIHDLARQFAEWYLRFYPQALLSGNHLSFFYTGALKQRKTERVILLVLLDGLHLIDARQFLQALQAQTRRLVIREHLVFAPVPTVTEFAKEALLKAVPPRDVFQVPSVANKDISERQSPIQQLEAAQADELLVWRIQEPDHTYHARNSSETLEREIEGQLDTIAHKVADIVEKLSPYIPLQLVLTTDHGRLLGVSQRRVPIPPGMQAHGRAAWGPAGQVFPATGYVLDGNLAYLCGERYGLDKDTAVILDEDAFRTNDGKQGQEQFAHGGLFPEEVIVPWIVLVRDAVMETGSVIVNITGKGKAGQRGVASVRIINSSKLPVVLHSIRIALSGKSQPEEHVIDIESTALSETTDKLELDPWPFKTDLKHANALAVLRWPNGQTDERPADLDLESEEMYSRDTSLIDKLDL